MDFAGITDLWNHGLTELWNYGKGESAHCSLLIAQSLSILSLPSIPFKLLPLVFRQRSVSEASQQDNETTSGAAAGGLRRNYGFMESRIDGIMELRKLASLR